MEISQSQPQVHPFLLQLVKVQQYIQISNKLKGLIQNNQYSLPKDIEKNLTLADTIVKKLKHSN